jgi:polysaccharide pyruvyl transferase WcaK-like protein
MNLIAPFGFYGAGNIGDESTLQGFAALLARSGEGTGGWVGSRDPRHTRRVESCFRYFRSQGTDLRRRWAWLNADAMVVPGGTPIMDVLGSWPFSELLPLVERAARARKPIAFIGTGTERLIHDHSKRAVAEIVAPQVAAWTVRCTRDRDRLIEYGVPAERVTPAADLAWMLDPVSADEGRERLATLGVPADAFLVGVNVNIEQFVRAKRPNLLADLAGFLDRIVDVHDAHVIFLCNEVRDGETYDLAASRELISFMRRASRATIVPNEYWAPQTMLSLIACCRFTMSTRYHFCLFSALEGVPFLAVKRSDKVADLCDDADWRHGVGLDEVSVDRLLAVASDLAEQGPELADTLRTLRGTMRERALRNASALTALRSRLAG